MKRLENLILDRIDDESLYLLYERYPSLRIDEEWKRRLISCDPFQYLPTLNLLYQKNIPKSVALKQGLYQMRNCFPFRIAVIYDYRTGQVKSLHVRLGITTSRYTYKGNPITFTWLDANESKKLLREIISSNSSPSQFSIKLGAEESKQVRDMLLGHKVVDLDVIVIPAINNPFHSFPSSSPLTGGEDFVVYPRKISTQNKSVILYPANPDQNIISFPNIQVKYSPDVIKYLSVISQN